MAALYALPVSALLYRSVRLSDVYQSLATSARITVSLGMLIAGAMVFKFVITSENIPKTLSGMLKAYELPPLMFLLFVNIVMTRALALITLVPDLVLFLPRIMGYKG